jgi:hypothetical protein|tara:strand:- start:6209 stop:6907 length:699 start_codon:yes stop_codon:yes gene_type:complete
MSNKKTKQITTTKTYNLGSPSQMIAMSKVLRKHVVDQKLYANIVGKNYAYVEGWQFAGGLMGLYPRVKRVKDLSTEKEIKWRADVEIIDMKTQDVVGYGMALCSSLEAKKKGFDEYAIASMAQTRAIGKAYRNLIGWVMKLAGYEGTPGEEMFKTGQDQKEKEEKAMPNVKGIWQETGDILKILNELGFESDAKKIAEIERITSGKVKTLKMTHGQAKTVLAELLVLKAKKK